VHIITTEQLCGLQLYYQLVTYVGMKGAARAIKLSLLQSKLIELNKFLLAKSGKNTTL
jgi:hypothetical protein